MSKAVSKAVLITGCSTGIGRVTATRLAARGHRVYATARRASALGDLRAAGCQTLELDVCSEKSRLEAVDTIVSAEGAIGVLINNAGYGSEGPVEEIGLDEMRLQFETNVFGLIRLCQLALPGMRAQGFGRIINLSSVGGRVTLPGGGIYHASKYAVEALSDALRFEVAGFGVHVAVIEPGTIKTEFGNTALAKVDASAPPTSVYATFRRTLKRQIEAAYSGPMAILAGEPEDVAKVIERAATARRPRTRYPVTLGARLLMGMRRWLPDRAFDAFLRTQFDVPKLSAHQS